MLVLDDEREHRLGQEPRLEDPPAVLVRDAALTAVPDRLDDGHADMAGLLLDGVDDRLDALPDYDRLDLDSSSPGSFPGPKKKTPGALPLRPRCLLLAAFLGGEKAAP